MPPPHHMRLDDLSCRSTNQLRHHSNRSCPRCSHKKPCNGSIPNRRHVQEHTKSSAKHRMLVVHHTPLGEWPGYNKSPRMLPWPWQHSRPVLLGRPLDESPVTWRGILQGCTAAQEFVPNAWIARPNLLHAQSTSQAVTFAAPPALTELEST